MWMVGDFRPTHILRAGFGIWFVFNTSTFLDSQSIAAAAGPTYEVVSVRQNIDPDHSAT